MAALAVTAVDTVQTAKKALIFCRNHDYGNATQCLVKVQESGRILVSKTQNAHKRLEDFENWLSTEYESQARELQELNYQKQMGEKRIASLEERERHLQQLVQENISDIDKARRREQNALQEKADAERKFKSILSPMVLIPGYPLFWAIRETIENNLSVAEEAAEDARRYAKKQKNLEDDIGDMRTSICKGRESVSELYRLIQAVECKSNEQHSKLSQTRLSISLTVKALKMYSEFAELAEEAVDSTMKLEKIVKMAQELQEEIEESGAAQNYEDCWDYLEKLATGELSGIYLQYTCSSCQNTFNGVPWSIRFNVAVFCKDCCC